MSQDKFLETFDSASETISKRFPKGTIRFLTDRFPALLKQIDSAEKEINEHWGKDLSVFGKAVDNWKGLWLSAIFKFRQAGTIPEKKETVSIEKIPQKTKPTNIFDIMRGS